MIEIAFQHREGALLALGRDHPVRSTPLPSPAMSARSSNTRNRPVSRISAIRQRIVLVPMSIKALRLWTHRRATNSSSFSAGATALSRAHAARSASARRDIISFFALPRRRAVSGGINPKLTFIG